MYFSEKPLNLWSIDQVMANSTRIYVFSWSKNKGCSFLRPGTKGIENCGNDITRMTKQNSSSFQPTTKKSPCPPSHLYHHWTPKMSSFVLLETPVQQDQTYSMKSKNIRSKSQKCMVILTKPFCVHWFNVSCCDALSTGKQKLLMSYLLELPCSFCYFGKKHANCVTFCIYFNNFFLE